MTEAWFRNPHNYIRELVEAGEGNIAWDRGMLQKRRIDPHKHASTYFGQAKTDWRLLLIGEQGTAEYRAGDAVNPVGVYPTWDASNDDLALLDEMMQYPLGDDADACNSPNVKIDERPVSGQEHRVVVTNIPSLSTGPAKAMGRRIKELQEDYPECILHIHGTYSWRFNFGMGFASADVDPRTNAGKGKVTLPSGKEVIAEKTILTPQWVTLLGMSVVEISKEPRKRCIFNIKSAAWAGEHFMENIAFKSKGYSRVNPDSTNHSPVEVKNGIYSRPNLPIQPTDKISCNTCTLANSCKYYREGSVCSVPGSEPSSLAKYFGTRDSDTIIDGLSHLTALGARRLEKGIRDEDLYGELDPEVTKIANMLFAQGEKLAKLVDPSLRAGPAVQVNVGGAVGASASTPNQLMGGIIRELESRGVPRAQITPDMIANFMAEMGEQRKAPQMIESTVITSKDENA